MQPAPDHPTNANSSTVAVRPARPADVPVLVHLIRALAEYKRAPKQAMVKDEDLHQALFCGAPQLFAHVAEHDGAIVGMAIWFVNFSTWTGRHGIYLEDLFVVPSARGTGAGRALLAELARVACDRGYTRLEWAVLDWNETAIGFYRHLGARPNDGWTVFRLAGPSLVQLAEQQPD
jgi:GNAT superfamily N-acetyltransferase